LQNAAEIQSAHRLRASPDVAPKQRNRAFTVHAPERVYVGDLTSLPTGEGWLYLAVVLELGSRAVVGWSMADHRRAEWVNQAVAMALDQRQPAAGLIRHTDRGSQYGAESYRQFLRQPKIPPSMSRKGNCGDNAVAESVLHTLKTELIYQYLRQLRQAEERLSGMNTAQAGDLLEKLLQ
jgi:transposase InsO family protein